MKILVLAGLDTSLLNFRGPLLRAFVAAGHDVIAAAPAQNSDVPQRLKSIGVRFGSVSLARASVNPLADLASLRCLSQLFKRELPDIVLCYTIKPVIYGSLAASWAGVPRIYALITGLGAAFNTSGFKGRVLRFITVTMYRISLKRCTKVFVQNQDIADLFSRENIVPINKLMVVAGSGVDTSHFVFSPIPGGAPIFLLLARMLRDKGVAEYAAAARLVKAQIPQARFLLVGDTDPNPAAISRKQLDQWHAEGGVEYRSAVSDVRALLCDCSVYVLPSYHEGMPRSVLEAMSTGRPVITTDTIGCRETISRAGAADHEDIRTGENGLLVPVRSIEPLASAMVRLAMDPGLRMQMGRRGREIAEQQFDVRLINGRMLHAMDLAGRGN